MRRVVVLGSTGSVGTQALDVIERSDELEAVALAAATSFEPLIEQARRFGVERVALADEGAAARAAAGSSARAIRSTPKRRACSISGSKLVEAASPTTSSSSLRSTTSRACVPIEPVDPRTMTLRTRPV